MLIWVMKGLVVSNPLHWDRNVCSSHSTTWLLTTCVRCCVTKLNLQTQQGSIFMVARSNTAGDHVYGCSVSSHRCPHGAQLKPALHHFPTLLLKSFGGFGYAPLIILIWLRPDWNALAATPKDIMAKSRVLRERSIQLHRHHEIKEVFFGYPHWRRRFVSIIRHSALKAYTVNLLAGLLLNKSHFEMEIDMWLNVCLNLRI